MKLKESFITHNTDNEQIMVDSECNFSGLIRNNPTAALIVDFLKKETNEKEIANLLFERFDAPLNVIESDVHEVIEKLRSVGAIED